jgi:hypothetical protein
MVAKREVVELRCATVVVSHRALASSPGLLYCLPLACGLLRISARGWTLKRVTVVSLTMEVSHC